MSKPCQHTGPLRGDAPGVPLCVECIREEEREACAKVAEEIAAEFGQRAIESARFGHNSPGFNQDIGEQTGAKRCAEAIRARGSP